MSDRFIKLDEKRAQALKEAVTSGGAASMQDAVESALDAWLAEQALSQASDETLHRSRLHAAYPLSRIRAPLPADGAGARKLSIDGYFAFYRIEPDAIFIVRVADQRRLLDAIAFVDE